MRLFVLTAMFATGLAASAQAETLTRSLDGTKLETHLACVKSVEIQPTPSLQGKIEIEASAASHDELAPLEFAGGTIAKIQRTGNCGIIFSNPTLTLSIKVPPATPLDLHDAGAGHYTIGPVGAALKLELAGSGDVEAAQSNDLDLHIAGSGNLVLQRLDGPAKIDIRGSGDATIVAGTMPSLAIELRGSGDAKIGAGEIGTLSANVAGSGAVHIDGTVKDATLSTAGSGDIDIAKATGAVQSKKLGSGTIRVGK
jgi:Putative auto-transporter adhesin, head GIN domain